MINEGRKQMRGASRRDFFKKCGLAVSGIPAFFKNVLGASPSGTLIVDDFERPDSFYHGDGWESINPGYWKIQGQALRRRLENVGDDKPTHWFPWHWETHRDEPMPIHPDPSLPFGMIWRPDWNLQGNYTIRIETTVRALAPSPEANADWKQYQPGYALMGICFGGRSLYEGWQGQGQTGSACWYAAWRDSGTFGIYDHSVDDPKPVPGSSEEPAPDLRPGDRVTIEVSVGGPDPETATLTASLIFGKSVTRVECANVERQRFTNGHPGLVARGLLDFEVNQVSLEPQSNQAVQVPLNELHVCYPLGDTLREIEQRWQCRFVALFRNEGQRAQIRISEVPDPIGGWEAVAVAGSATIQSNGFRRNTAILDVTLPSSSARKTLYYTVWKDGRDVTADPRSGFLGKKNYVGRLPRLSAPYGLCGLSCHAIHGNSPDLPNAGRFEENWVHDQPTPDAYKYLEDYDFQIMLWEDDVWYLELLFPPPSTDDAYKIITTTLGGPTTRWQMMRHWNVLNPGDHDHGMDDVKGPEQLAVRNHGDLGQDSEYMRRNFQIVYHLMSGQENPSPTGNPKRWRRWKMPGHDFSLLIMDSRLWRTSQDTNIWDDEGWGHKDNLYDRADPTRALLGEEQFAWLQEMISTDTSPLICLTGINGLHTIWTGNKRDPRVGAQFKQRDRVAADYAGWVKAGSDRVIELLGSREGVLSVYGDVHSGCILKNVEQGLYECSFGPIGRTGGRGVKPGFGPRMQDYDGREVQVHALYHQNYGSPDLQPLEGPQYWNFLEMHFDPRREDPVFHLKFRNLIDPPGESPRGGGFIEDRASNTGRRHGCRLPRLKTLPDADVLFLTTNEEPIRGVRSLSDGTVPVRGLVGVAPDTPVLMTSFDGLRADAQVIRTLPEEK